MLPFWGSCRGATEGERASRAFQLVMRCCVAACGLDLTTLSFYMTGVGAIRSRRCKMTGFAMLSLIALAVSAYKNRAAL